MALPHPLPLRVPAAGQLARASPSQNQQMSGGGGAAATLFARPTGVTGIAPSVRTGRGLFGEPRLSGGGLGRVCSNAGNALPLPGQSGG